MTKTTAVIINWNGERFLKKLINRLRDEDCQVLVVDNASTDNSFDIAPIGTEWLQLNNNWGFSIGNNIGGAVAETENILFINNDTLPKKGFLKPMEDRCTSEFPIVGAKLIFGETKDVKVTQDLTLSTTEGLVQHAGVGINDSGLPFEMGRMTSPDDLETTTSKEVEAVTGACLMIKSRVFNELRGFNTSFINGFEDVDLCWRAREKGYRCWYEAKSEVVHYCSSSKGRFDHERENRNLLIELWPPERVEKIKI